MIASWILFTAATSTMSCASRFKLEPGLRVVPRTIIGPMIPAPVNVLHLHMQVPAPAYGDISKMLSNSTTQGWTSIISDTSSEDSIVDPVVKPFEVPPVINPLEGSFSFSSPAPDELQVHIQAAAQHNGNVVQQQIGLGVWTVGRNLGSGSFSQVWELTKMLTGQKYAGKVIKNADRWPSLQIEDPEQLAAFQQEVAMQKRVQEKNGPDIHLLKAESDLLELSNGDWMIVMELMPEGELTGLLEEFREAGNAASVIQDIFGQIVDGVKHMHEAGVVHRNLKPSNIFCDISSTSPTPTCKIGHFGCATTYSIVPRGELSQLADKAGFLGCLGMGLVGWQFTHLQRGWLEDGSPLYSSPEIWAAGRWPFKRYRGPEVDVWALGVTLYYMLVGRYPFDSNLTPIDESHHRVAMVNGAPRPSRTYAEIDATREWVVGPEPHQELTEVGVDPKAIDLISHMLDKNPMTRYTIQKVAKHPYLAPTSEQV